MISKTLAKMGRIKYWYCGQKGYGFIRPEEGGKAVFVHYTCMAPHQRPKSPREGARVIYEMDTKKTWGLWAKNVRIID